MKPAAGRILIADDDAAIYRLVSLYLKAEGFETVHACDGYRALHLAHELRPDLILLDLYMPAGDGSTVHERILKVPTLAPTPIIYLTSDRSQAVRDRAKQTGAQAVLHKPVSAVTLVGMVRGAIGFARKRNSA